MVSSKLPIPVLLSNLIASGVWTPPGSRDGEWRALGKAAARKLSPDDDQLVLVPPPFLTIADNVAEGNSWWMTDLTNVGEIDYYKALIIADFGMGSDSPIVLYYKSPVNPVVMYLQWTWKNQRSIHRWKQTHSSFLEFALDIGLVEPSTASLLSRCRVVP